VGIGARADQGRVAHAARGGPPLLAEHPGAGEMLIGLSGVGAGDSLSLLFQVAPGTNDPDAEVSPLQWSVLASNYWRPLEPQEMQVDTTRDLRRSGLLAFALPRETSIENTLMPTGMVWLRGMAARNANAVCELVNVHANGIELVSVEAQASASLEPGVISKAKAPPAIKKFQQPYAGFGGRPAEPADRVAARAAERVRHRGRCVSAWDYERAVLEAFPSLHRVKCLPHASPDSWFAPGNVTLVVIPKTAGRGGDEHLRPRCSLDELEEIRAFAASRCGGQTRVFARNPRHQQVLVACEIRLRPGLGFHFYAAQTDAALVSVLSPWASDETRSIEFGGGIDRSSVLRFVEELPFIESASRFKLLSVGPDGAIADQPRVEPMTPDSVLVSAPRHQITEYTGE
ncbi:MAG: hypothetical protein ACOYN0_16755, partial [Phycisphaerales bacterium]